MAIDMHPLSTSTSPIKPPTSRIAIVEDEPVISEQIREALVAAGFDAVELRSGQELKALLGRAPVNLVLLDLGLPGEDGFGIVRELHARYDVPIMIVTAATRQVERIMGFAAGADDYVVKPVDLDELVARVRAVLRRANRAESAGGRRTAAAPAVGAASGMITFEGWRFDIAGHRLRAPSGELVDLTAAECDLLAVFVGSPRIALSRAEIARQLRGEDDKAAERSIDVIVGRLRRKLESHAGGIELIKTLRGSGYLFCVEVHPE